MKLEKGTQSFFSIVSHNGHPQKSTSNGQLLIFETEKEALSEVVQLIHERIVKVNIFYHEKRNSKTAKKSSAKSRTS